MRQRPDVTNDPQAPAVLAAMEEKTLDLAFEEALKHLVDDIMVVSRASRTLKRVQAKRIIRNQDDAVGDSLHTELNRLMDPMVQHIARSISHPESPNSSTGARDLSFDVSKQQHMLATAQSVSVLCIAPAFRAQNVIPSVQTCTPERGPL